MVELVGYYRGVSKNGKPFGVIHYTVSRDGMVWGDQAESCVCSVEYADKLISYTSSGGILKRGWDKKEGKPFLYIPKN